MLRRTLEASEGLDVTVLYATSARPFDISTLASLASEIPLVITTEPFYEGTIAAALTARTVFTAGLVALLALVPVYALATGETFGVALFTRTISLAIGAVSLNLIMGYGGMVSFGHAAYLGIGGYAVGILAKEGIGSGFVQWPVAVAASALYALVVGALSLRTRGVYFIMITLAFAQMANYVTSGLARYGGDDGLTIYKRSDFGGLVNLSNRVQFYYLCLACLFGGLYLVWRIVNSRFGLVVQGLRSNEARMQAKGMGSLLGVSRGSDEPATLSVLTYMGDPSSKEILALVGIA